MVNNEKSSREKRRSVTAASAAGVVSGLTGAAAAEEHEQEEDEFVTEDEETEEISLTVNGDEQTFDVDPETPLLYVLRNEAELNGPRFGCGLSQCGACEVLVDDSPVISCTTSVSEVEGSDVTTASGLGTSDDPHPIQEAFIEEQAAQCGYCSHGMLMSTKALLDENPDPSDEEIRAALEDNLCRCGTHTQIINAVNRAADNMDQAND